MDHCCDAALGVIRDGYRVTDERNFAPEVLETLVVTIAAPQPY